MRRARPNAAEDVLRYADLRNGPRGAPRVARRPTRCISARPSTGCCVISCRTPAACSAARNCSTGVWGRDAEVELRTVDVHIRRLRKALNACGGDLIRTVRAVGYALDSDG